MDQSYRHENNVPSAPQEPTTPTQHSDELTATDLTLMVGGTDEAPGGPGEGTSETLGGGRTVPIFVPS